MVFQPHGRNFPYANEGTPLPNWLKKLVTRGNMLIRAEYIRKKSAVPDQFQDRWADVSHASLKADLKLRHHA